MTTSIFAGALSAYIAHCYPDTVSVLRHGALNNNVLSLKMVACSEVDHEQLYREAPTSRWQYNISISNCFQPSVCCARVDMREHVSTCFKLE